MKLRLFGFVNRNKTTVNVSSVNISYKGTIHTLKGIKAKKEFTYRMPFANRETHAIRILSISVSEPFSLVKLNTNLPRDIAPEEKVNFELHCRFEKDYNYEGPLAIKVDVLPLMGSSQDNDREKK